MSAVSRWLGACLAIAATLATSFGAAACGDENRRAEDWPDVVGVLPDPDRRISDDGLAQGTGDRAEIQEVVDDVQDGLLTVSGWGVCNELTNAAALRVAARGRCVETYERILRSGDNPLTRRVRSRVVSVDVGPGGRVAVATMESPGRGQFRVRFVNAQGSWKLPGLDLDDPTGLRAE